MAIFELNFNEIDKDISGMNSAVSNYKETMNTLKTNFKNVDSFWNDNNTDAFIENVKKDYIVYDNYINSIKDYIKYIEEFCDSLKKLIENKMGTHNASHFSINTDQLYSIISNLNDAYGYINNCVNDLSEVTIPFDFKYKYTLELYLSNFRSYRDQIGNLKNDLYSIYSSVLSKIDYYKTKINLVERYTISDSVISYKWQVATSNFVKNDNNVNQKKFAVNSNPNENIDAKTSELTVEKEQYAIGSSTNEVIKDEEYTHEEQLYTVQSNHINEELYDETNESLEVKNYGIGMNENDDLENKTYTLDEKIYGVNNIEANNNLTETDIVSPEDKNYMVNVNENNQNLGDSTFNVNSNEYTVSTNESNQSLENSDVSVGVNEYTVGSNESNQGLKNSNVSVGVNEYTVGSNESNQSLKNSNVSVNASEYIMDNNVIDRNLNKTEVIINNDINYDN